MLRLRLLLILIPNTNTDTNTSTDTKRTSANTNTNTPWVVVRPSFDSVPQLLPSSSSTELTGVVVDFALLQFVLLFFVGGLARPPPKLKKSETMPMPMPMPGSNTWVLFFGSHLSSLPSNGT